MKILYISTTLELGGAEAVAVAMAEHAKLKWGWTVEYVSLMPGGDRQSALKEAGIPTHCLGLNRGIPNPQAVVRLAKIIRDFKPDLIHSHMLHSNLIAQLHRAIFGGPPLISTSHSVDEIRGRKPLAWMHRMGRSQSALTTNICEAGTHNLIAHRLSLPEKTICVPNGIQLEKFRNSAAARSTTRQKLGLTDSFTFIAIGRHEPPKDIPCLIDSFATVLQERPDTILLYVGDGTGRDSTEKEIASRGLRDSFKILGSRRDIRELLAASDAFVMSSAWEGLPMVLLEAGASGLPLISTNVGGTAEIVVAEKAGYLVAPRRPDLLAGAMIRMIDLPSENRLEMGTASRQHVAANFDADVISARWYEIYTGLVSSAAHPANERI
ncbi:glycosyltransferase [Candidatus Binatia bacterium]|nr:glycosyltransferase [Candidatus Binatia bacterium]